MHNSIAKKIFAVGASAATVLMGLAPFVAGAAPHPAGTNVISGGTVWMITLNGTRRGFSSEGAFLSYGFNSWSGVVAANADDVALPIDSAGLIPAQDGSIICSNKGADAGPPATCYVISGSQKFGFVSESVFSGQGFNWNNARSGDISFLTNGGNITSASAGHLSGTLVSYRVNASDPSDTVFLITPSGKMGIPDLNTFNSWGYSFNKVVPGNAVDKAVAMSSGVMAPRVPGQLNPTALGASNTTPCVGSSCPATVVNGTVTATLAADNPAAGTLVSSSVNTTPGQTGADLAHFTFSGSGTVTQVVINRIGVSSDTSINNVYLYVGNNRITDAGSFSQGKVTFSNAAGLFTVSSPVTISVRVDVAGNISGQTVGAQLGSFTVASGTPVASSISGNLFSIAQVNNLATATVPLATSVTGSGANNGNVGTINAGTANAILWSAPVTISQRNVLFKYVAFKQIGSISSDAIINLKLMVDGTQVGSTASITNSGGNTNVVIFDMFASPITLQSGTHTIELHGDIVKGSSFNYNFSIQTGADTVFFDTNYGVNIPFTLASGAQIFQLSPGTTTINAGVISVQQDVAFTATQFVANQSQTVLGQWTMKAFGENVKVQNLQVSLTYTGVPTATEGFNNLSLFVNGGAVGSSLSALGPSNTYTFGSSNLFTVPAGQTVTLAVKGDSVLNSNTAVTAVLASLITPANSLQGVTSFTLSPTGGSITYTGRTLTTGNSNATTAINSQFTNTNLTTNQLNQKIGSYVIQAGSIDGVRVSSLTVGFPAGANNTFPLTSLANLYITTTSASGTPVSATPVSPNASNNFSVNFTVPLNQTATVDVFADVGNNTGGTVTNLNVPTAVTGAGSAGTAGTAAGFASGFVTAGGYFDSGDTLTATISGVPFTFTSGAASTSATTAIASLISNIATNSALATATASTTNASSSVISARTAGTAGNGITLLASATGHGTGTPSAGGTLTGGTAGTAGTASTNTVTVGPSVVIGNTFTITSGATSVTYTAVDTSTSTVASGLASLVNAQTLFPFTATSASGVVTVTQKVVGVAAVVVASSALAGSQSAVNGGTVQTSLIGSGSGATSNQSILINSTGTTGGVAVNGQVLTVGTGTLSSVSLTGSSPTSSFVLGGGVNQPAATYTFKVNVTGGVTITELGFNATSSTGSNNTISSVTVGGSTGAAVGNRFLVTGLNIAVPVGNAGWDVPVTVTYANVGPPSTVVDQTSLLSLNHVKYLAGNSTVVNGTVGFDGAGVAAGVIGATGIKANTMFLSGTIPTVALQSNTNTLVAGSDIIGSVMISATGGRLDMRQLPLVISTSGAATITAGTLLLIEHATGRVVATTPITTLTSGTNTVTVVFSGTDGLDQISGGSSRTYDVQVSGVGGTCTTGGACSIVLQLGSATLFTFNDINGNTNGVAGAIAPNTFIVNYPTNSVSIKN